LTVAPGVPRGVARGGCRRTMEVRMGSKIAEAFEAWRGCRDRLQRLDQDAKALAAKFPHPPEPDAIRITANDARLGILRLYGLSSGRPHSLNHWKHDALSRLAAGDVSPEIPPKHAAAAQRRAAEIVAAYDAWRSACDAVNVQSGGAELNAMSMVEAQHEYLLRIQIAVAPATCIADVFAKVEVMAFCVGDTLDEVEETMKEEPITYDDIAVSIGLDFYRAREAGWWPDASSAATVRDGLLQ
jgi:hypothetical protein